MIKVEVGQLGNEELDMVTLSGPSSVKDVAEQAGIKYNAGTTIQVNMVDVNEDHLVQDGDIVIFVPAVGGGILV